MNSKPCFCTEPAVRDRCVRWIRAAIPLLGLMLLAACRAQPRISQGNTLQQQQAIAMWKERCQRSGEFIHRTVDGVEGIYLVNLRTRINMGESQRDQFELDDPYGNDSFGDNYVLNFLRGFYYRTPETKPTIVGAPPRIGFSYVEALDPKDGKLYRYTGRVEQPWLNDKSYAKNYTRFVLDRKAIGARSARYGVQFDDISTHDERQNWIAGSSLKVIDLETREVLGERIGYMVDWAQGSRLGGRSPWLLAANNACPSFFRRYPIHGAHASTAQPGQTLDFVEIILKRANRER